MKKLIASIFVLSLFAGVQSLDACSPGPGYPFSLQENYDRHEVVFVGTVTSVVQDKSIYGNYRIQFNVEKMYKGNTDRTLTVTTSGSSASCGYDDAYQEFKKGSVWAIYATKDLDTMSLSQNTEYSTFKEVVTILDALKEGPKICTMQYAPVCGWKDTGIRCITTPCNSIEYKTYGNSCVLGAEGAEYAYEGECRAKTPVLEVIPVPAQDTEIDASNNDASSTSNSEVEVQISFFQMIIGYLKSIIFFWR